MTEFHIVDEEVNEFKLYEVKSSYEKVLYSRKQSNTSSLVLPFSPVSAKLLIKDLSQTINKSTTLVEAYSTTTKENIEKLNTMQKLFNETKQSDEEIKKIKNEDLNKRIISVQKELDKSTLEIMELKKQIEKNRVENELLKKENNELSDLITQHKEKTQNDFDKLITILRDQNKEKDNQICELKQTVEDKQKDKDKTEDEMTTMRFDLEKTKNENELLKTEIEKLKNQQISQLQQQEKLNNENKMKELLKQNENKIKELQSDIITKLKEISDLKLALENSRNKQEQVDGKEKQYSVKFNLLEQQLKEEKDKADTYQTQSIKLKLKETELNGIVEKNKTELETLRSKVEKLEERNRILEEERIKLKAFPPAPPGTKKFKPSGSPGLVIKESQEVPTKQVQQIQQPISKPAPRTRGIRIAATQPIQHSQPMEKRKFAMPAAHQDYDIKVESKFEPNTNDLPYNFKPVEVEVQDGRNKELKKYWNKYVQGKVTKEHVIIVCKGFGYDLNNVMARNLMNAMDNLKNGIITFPKFHDTVMNYVNGHKPNRRGSTFTCP